jgi:hypothetical protein
LLHINTLSKMAKENNNKLMGAALLIGIGVAGYFLLFKKMTRPEAIALLAINGHADASLSDPTKYADPYIISWGNAIKKKEWVFIYNGKQYSTQTGKAS